MPRHNEPKKIGDLFEKYKTLLTPPQKTVEKAFREIVKNELDLDIPPDGVTYTVATKTIHLSVPSVLKQELLLHKTDLEDALKERLGGKGDGVTIL